MCLNTSPSFADTIINRPGVAGAVLQTPLLLRREGAFVTHLFIDTLTDPFPPNLQNIITPKPLELGS